MMAGYTQEDLEYLSLTLAGEARGEQRQFQFAVGEVIMTRWKLAQAGRAWRRAKCIREIVTWPWQFSCWNIEDPNRQWIDRARALKLSITDADALRQCRWIAEGFLRGVWRDELGQADHYHVLPLGQMPRWADSKKLVKRVEARLATGWFYRLII